MALIIFIALKPSADTSKTKLSDFSAAVAINQNSVVSANYHTNFNFALKSGAYEAGDAVYVIMNNSATIYTKYVLTQANAETLKTKDLSLSLSVLGQVTAYKFNYYVVSAKDVARFETLFNPPAKNGTVKNLQPEPMVQTIEFDGALRDKKITPDEYTADNEAIRIVLMQSQLYDQNTYIKLHDNLNKVDVETVTLTAQELLQLQTQNLSVDLDLAAYIDSIEGTAKVYNYTLSVVSGDNRFYATSFSVTIAS